MNELHKITLPVNGMHCRSCEMLLEEKLSAVEHVKKTDVSFKEGKADIFFSADSSPRIHNLEKAIIEAGYTIGEAKKSPWFSKNPGDYKAIFNSLLLVFFIYGILRFFGLTDMNVGAANNPSSIGVVILVGLVAGFSTCMALVGGLTLGMSAKFAENHPAATPKQKFRPHLYFNGGRILGYAFFGGLLGMVGSAFQLSPAFSAFLTVLVGLVMLLMGLQLTELMPKLNSIKLTLPKGVAKALGVDSKNKEYSHKNSMILGASTFFLPCGFTQAMQLYAVSSGNATDGAIIMGLFALGTAPGLLSVGGLTSIFKGESAKRFFKFAGTIVVLLSLFNLKNGLTLLGWTPEFNSTEAKAITVQDPNVKMVDGVQVVSMSETNRGYEPNRFTIKAGVPVRWEINAKAPYSCASALVVRQLNISRTLKAGLNVIEFTPKEAGSLKFSCSMGMYTGNFNVVDGSGSTNSAANEPAVDDTASAAVNGGGSCGSSGGGCGCGGGRKTAPTDSKPAVTTNDAATDEQVIKTVYTQATDIQPSEFTVKAGKPVRFEINAQEDGGGCMSYIKVSNLAEEPQLLEAGKTITMQFTPTEPGTYQITCAMGMVRGHITVN
jgi:sulfite exporter TauE/SafE/plastocyanin domain-containing protein/copper chaperone CopZ